MAAGGIAKGVDTCLAGMKHDVSDDVIFEDLCSLVASGAVKHLWLGVVCSSLSQLWLKKGRPRLRSRQQPDGIVPMPAQWRGYIARANVLIERAAWLAYLQWWAGNTYFIENPTDVGFWRSPYFKWSKRAAVSLWITTPLRWLAEKTDPTWGTTAFCGWLGPFQKLTTVCSAGPAAGQVLTINEVQCSCTSHSLLADGLDADGRQLSALAGQYPPLFCGFFGHNFTHSEQWSARTAAATTQASRQLLSIIEKQRPPPRAPEPYRAEQHPEQQQPIQEWTSAHGAIPQAWPEHIDVTGEAYQEARREPLRFVSRRRAEAEDGASLASRPMPTPSPPQPASAIHRYAKVPWPAGCPPRPIRLPQLYNDGVYDKILADIDAVAAACQKGKLTGRMPKCKSTAYTPEKHQPSWARECVWDATDPEDCVPMQPSLDEAPPQGARPSFFVAWANRIKWPDHDMIRQVALTGVESNSKCSKATIISGHHRGLREHFAEANESIEADRERGFISEGRRDLFVVPSFLVPKNCVERRVWKLDESGQLHHTSKWRVSTDDSISIEGEISRNEGMDAEEWAKPGLPSPRTLAEMVAIVKSKTDEMNISATRFEAERIALWAFDLSHAYRELAIQKMEQGHQCFCFWDGVRLDRRCVFGAAHMVDFFQRVTSFILAVGRFRIREYEAQHPFSPEREAWRQWRKRELGVDEGCGQSCIYIDDGLGLTVLEPNEKLEGDIHFHSKPVKAGLGVEGGGHVRLSTYVNMSRVQIDLAVMRTTFQEAGWGIAEDKVQLSMQLQQLGTLLSSEGEGILTVPEAKRQGMLVEISEQQNPQAADKAVPAEHVDGLVGRALHLAMLAPEANATLQPMYAMKEAKRAVGRRSDGSVVRVRPSRLTVCGDKPAQQAYQLSLDWWAQALEDGISCPLAPRLTFPELGEEGAAFMFTDAAREARTGMGAFTFVQDAEGQLIFLFFKERWQAQTLADLQADKLSMPAGECLGAVIFADALINALGGVTHLSIFTDSMATKDAIQSSSSGSPQMNVIVQWLFQRHPSVQFLAIHQPGVRNSAADGLSRSAAESVRAEAEAAGASTRELHISQHATDLISIATETPQRARPRPAAQEA